MPARRASSAMPAASANGSVGAVSSTRRRGRRRGTRPASAPSGRRRRGPRGSRRSRPSAQASASSGSAACAGRGRRRRASGCAAGSAARGAGASRGTRGRRGGPPRRRRGGTGRAALAERLGGLGERADRAHLVAQKHHGDRGQEDRGDDHQDEELVRVRDRQAVARHQGLETPAVVGIAKRARRCSLMRSIASGRSMASRRSGEVAAGDVEGSRSTRADGRARLEPSARFSGSRARRAPRGMHRVARRLDLLDRVG